MFIKKKPLAPLIAALLFTSCAYAQEEDRESKEDRTTEELSEITIIGNTINTIDNTLPSVDVINPDLLTQPTTQSIKDIIQYNPSLAISSDSAGEARGFYLRGLGENYVELTLDGTPLPEYFVYGPYVSAGRDFIEPETLKQVDIVKGPHSPKQSAGAIAGSVNFATYTPSDFVDADNNIYASLKSSYTSKNRGVGATATLVGGNDDFAAMVMVTKRQYHELDNMGSDATKTKNNKQDIDKLNVLVKGEANIDKLNFVLTAEQFKRDTNTTARYRPNAQTVEENTKRSRVAAKMTATDVGFADSAIVSAYMHNWEEVEYVARGRNDFEQNGYGMSVDLDKAIDAGSMAHNLKAGIAYRQNKFDFIRTKAKGSGRTIPITKKSVLAGYVKDSVDFGNGFTLSPGLRVEHQSLKSEKDALYLENPALKASENYIPKGDTTTVTPTLNASFSPNDNLTFFASYARGNKQPDMANLGTFDHGFGWIIPNKDLKNETSNNYEFGFNYDVPNSVEFKLTGFYSKFHDFIDYKVDGVYGQTSSGKPKMIMRPTNVNEVETYGAEAELGYHVNDNLYLNSSLAWMKGQFGDEASHGVTLSQGYPTKLLLGATYSEDNWGLRLHGELVAASKKLPQSGYQKFETPGYGKWDLTGWYSINKHFHLNMGVYNLFDKKYWLSSDVNGLPLKSRGKPINFDRYTQPGRNFAFSFKAEL